MIDSTILQSQVDTLQGQLKQVSIRTHTIYCIVTLFETLYNIHCSESVLKWNETEYA
jgi:hypothetical protein